jgi:hypothetical protein
MDSPDDSASVQLYGYNCQCGQSQEPDQSQQSDQEQRSFS